jgi:hypothetical protein
MKRLTFNELATADPRTQRFTPYGLSTGSRILTPESCADFQQASVGSIDLSDVVPESTRTGFDRLRLFHAYGVLCYELFTITDDLTWIVLEQALRVRFVAYYQSAIPIKDRQGMVSTFQARNFEAISAAFRRGGSHFGHELVISPSSSTRMPLTLDPLLRWAHGVELLDGQRNRRVQLSVYADRRNHFAHGGNLDRLGMPPDSARAIHDLAEVINRLWGVRTPGGRIYPAPIARETWILAWDEGWPSQAGSNFGRFSPERLTEEPKSKWRCLIVLGPDVDQNWHDFDARFEITPYPVNYLWGPGNAEDALKWLAENDVTPDEVRTNDRIFAIRLDTGRVYLPMRLEILGNVPGHMRQGIWRLIQADFPNDAHFHARHQAGGQPCPDDRYGGCPVKELARGSWTDMVREAHKLSPDLGSLPYSDTRVPRRDEYPDDVGS